MDILDKARNAIEEYMLDRAATPIAYIEAECEVIIDRVRDRYVLMLVGWDNGKRVHGSLLHVDIIDGKIWIQRDGTEEGIAETLLQLGVPTDKIVPGFRSKRMRQDMGFAIA